MLTPVKMMSLIDVGGPIFGGSPPRLAQKWQIKLMRITHNLFHRAPNVHTRTRSVTRSIDDQSQFRTGLKLPGLEGLIEEEDVQETLEAAVEVAAVKEVVDLSLEDE